MPDVYDRLAALAPAGDSPAGPAAAPEPSVYDRLAAFRVPEAAPTPALAPTLENARRRQVAGLNVGRTPEEHEAYLKESGYSDEATKALGQDYRLAFERRKLSGAEGARYGTKETLVGGVLEQLGRHAVPFSDVLPTTAVGTNTRAAQQAQQRYARGDASPEDIKLIAEEGRLQEIDQQMGSTLGGKIISVAGGAPKILGEMAVGGKVLEAGGRALGFSRAVAPVTLTGTFSPTAARAALSDPTLARVVMTHAGRMAALTPLVPSMWLEEMQSRNTAEGRDANDITNAPPALAHAFSNMLVLGSMQKNFGLTGNLAERTAVKAGIFAGEQSVADSLYNVVDRQIQGANQWNTKYGTLEHLVKGEVGEAAREATVQAFTGALFAGMHEVGKGPPGEPARPDRIERVMGEVTSAFAKDVDSLAKTGLSPEGASKRLLAMQERIRTEIVAEDAARSQDLQNRMGVALAKAEVLTRGEPLGAAEVVGRMKLPGTDKPSALAERMADALKRADKLAPPAGPEPGVPRPRPAPAEAPQPPEVRAESQPAPAETGKPPTSPGETPEVPPTPEPRGAEIVPPRAAPEVMPGAERTTERPRPALTPRMARAQVANMDATDWRQMPREARDLLKSALERGGYKLEKVLGRALRAGEQQGDVVLDPEHEQVVDASDLSPARKRGVKALMTGASTRAAQKVAGEVSHETLRQDAIKLFGEEPIRAVEEAAAERLRSRMERQTQEGTTAEGLRYNVKPVVDEGGVLGGFPIHIEALDRWLADFKPIQWLKRNFLSRGALPAEVFREHTATVARINAYLQDVKAAERDFKSAVKDYANLTDAQLKVMNDALAGDARAAATLPPEVRDVLRRMRDQVDSLSVQLAASGLVDAKMAAVIGKNIGSYLTRQYRVFTDPTWFRDVPDAVKNRFKTWMAAEILRTLGRTATPEELEGTMKKFLHNDTAADNPVAFLAKSKLGSKDLSVLAARKDVPPELRALWGEFQDPLVNYTHSVGKMSALLANHLFLSKVRGLGLAGGFFTTDPTPENFVTVAAEGSETMSPLNGLHTTPELKKAFEEMYATETLPGYLKAYNAVVGLTKFSKTVASPITHLRNLLGNVGFAVANGHYRMGNAPAALKAVVSDTQAARDYYRRGVELGVIGEGVHENEFKAVVADALGKRGMAAGPASAMVSGDRVASWVRRGLGLATKLYAAEDVVWKVYAFENEKTRYASAYPGWTKEQVEQKAADNVRRTYPTYSNVPAGVKWLRKFPLIGPFVSFPSEVVRTTYHTAKLAVEEMRDPATRAIGATRFAGLTLSMGMVAGLASAMRSIMNMDWDQETAMRRFAPEWSKDGQWLHLPRGADGEYRYVDLGQTDAHNYLLAPVMAAVRSGSLREGAENVAGAVTQPFLGEELAARSLLDLGRNKNEQTGKQVYNPEEETGAKVWAGVKHFGKAVTPGAVEQGGKLFDAATGTVDPKTGRVRDVGEELSAVTAGQRVQAVRVGESLGLKTKEYRDALKNAEEIFGAPARQKGPVKDDDLKAAYARSETQRRAVFDEFRKDVLAAEKLGLGQEQIAKALKDAGLSPPEIGQLLSGTYVPDVPKVPKGPDPAEAQRRALLVRPPS